MDDALYDTLHRQIDKLEADLAAVRAQLEEWRAWAEYVSTGGGTPIREESDYILRLQVTKAHSDAIGLERADLAALRAERDSQQQWINRITDNTANLECMRRKLSDAEAELAEALARLAVPAWQEEVRKALEFCATATASVTPGYIDVPMTLAFVQAKAKEALALMPTLTPSETSGQLCRWCFKSIKEHTGTFLQCPNGVTYQQFEAAP